MYILYAFAWCLLYFHVDRCKVFSLNIKWLESPHEGRELYTSLPPDEPGSSPPSSSSSCLPSSWVEPLHRTHEQDLRPRQSTLSPVCCRRRGFPWNSSQPGKLLPKSCLQKEIHWMWRSWQSWKLPWFQFDPLLIELETKILKIWVRKSP